MQKSWSTIVKKGGSCWWRNKIPTHSDTKRNLEEPIQMSAVRLISGNIQKARVWQTRISELAELPLIPIERSSFSAELSNVSRNNQVAKFSWIKDLLSQMRVASISFMQFTSCKDFAWGLGLTKCRTRKTFETM